MIYRDTWLQQKNDWNYWNWQWWLDDAEENVGTSENFSRALWWTNPKLDYSDPTIDSSLFPICTIHRWLRLKLLTRMGEDDIADYVTLMEASLSITVTDVYLLCNYTPIYFARWLLLADWQNYEYLDNSSRGIFLDRFRDVFQRCRRRLDSAPENEVNLIQTASVIVTSTSYFATQTASKMKTHA